MKSNISRDRRLIQPSSIYAPIADIFLQRRVARSQGIANISTISFLVHGLSVGALATDVYARQVVAQTLKRRVKAWFWTGNFSFFCWFIDTFTGRRGFVSDPGPVAGFPSERRESGLAIFAHLWAFQAQGNYLEPEEKADLGLYVSLPILLPFR